MPVTGLVLTKDGERLIGRCLDSLSFCDRVVVVDSESTDRTREIATEKGAEVVVHPWRGPGPQFEFALSLIKTGWIVSLDQDEYASDELAAAVQEAVARDEDKAGYWVRRSNFYFDRFLRHSGWYPDRLLRVFRAGRMEVRISGAHYSFRPKGPTGRIEADIVHYPYDSLAQQLEKINYYAQAAADEMRERGKKGGLARGIAHGAARFLKLYVLQLGVLDGRAGLINAAHGTFYAFLKYVRAAEKRPWGE